MKWLLLVIGLLVLVSCSVDKGSVELFSIDRGSSVVGSFVLGTGSLSGRMYFFGWIKEGEGFKLASYERRYSTVYEVESNFRVHTYYDFSSGRGRYMYHIYVPKGTILREFKL